METVTNEAEKYPHQLSGGEITGEERELHEKLRNLIIKETDVHRLIDLADIGEGRWLYYIETPFRTFPKFVIGETDTLNEAPSVIRQFGAQWSSDSFWDQLTQPQP